MDNIPDYTLETIFSLLNESTLINVNQVCRRWSFIIKNSRKIARTLTHTINLKIDKSKVPFQFEMSFNSYKPIAGINYEKLVIIGTKVIESFNPVDENSNDFNSVRELEMRGCYLSQLPHWFGNVTHYKLINPRSIERIASSTLKEHTNLKHLEIEGSSFYDLSSLFNVLLVTKHLTHLRLHLNKKEKQSTNNVEEFLKYQQDSLRYLSIYGLRLIIGECIIGKNLSVLELEMSELEDNTELLQSIKRSGNWKAITFKNLSSEHEELTSKIVANHEEIISINFEYQQLVKDEIFTEIPELEKISFKFCGGSHRSIKDFSKVNSLEIKRIGTRKCLQTFIETLKMCCNLEVLKLNRISVRAGKNENVITSLFKATKNLRELHLLAYSEYFDITTNFLENFKFNAPECLEKFIISVDKKNADEIREKLKIFNDTKIRAIALETNIITTCLETMPEIKASTYPALCRWKRSNKL